MYAVGYQFASTLTWGTILRSFTHDGEVAHTRNHDACQRLWLERVS
jgi:hypothetical protein